MKKFTLPLLLLCLTPLVASCGKKTTVVEYEVTVTFYLDYNQVAAGNIYYTEVVMNGHKIEEPEKPTANQTPLEAYPVFLGWSTKEVIDDTKDLWNFDKDKLQLENTSKLSLFGIWVADDD